MGRRKLYRKMPCDVYHVYDEHGHLLYVGMSYNVFIRMYSHKLYAPWWPIAHHGHVVQYATRDQGEAEEARAIRDGRPIFNRRPEAFKTGGPVGEELGQLSLVWENGEVYADASNPHYQT